MDDQAPIRVTIVGPSLAYLGGQAVQAQRLLAGLRPDATLAVQFIPVNPALPGPFGLLQRIKYVRTLVTSVAYLLSLVRRLPRADVVHAFSASYWSFLLAPVPAMLVARLLRRPVILNYHSGEADDHLARWPGTRALARLASRIVVPSAYLVEVFGRHGLPATAIFNHVEAERMVARERRELAPRFLSNRNLEPHYGVDCVLRAFRQVQARYPAASLVVAGDGSERAALEVLAAQLALRNVTFTGPVAPERMVELYDAADVYLNASRIDNMPLSILEAFAAGLPVVTTSAGGIPYIVRHGENGLVVPVDDHEALAREAIRLLEDADLAARLSRDARAEVLERYTWRAVGKEWRALYHELAGRAPGRAGPRASSRSEPASSIAR